MKTMKNLSKALLLVLLMSITACSVDAIDVNEIEAQQNEVATEKLNSNEKTTQRSMNGPGGEGDVPSFTDNFTPTGYSAACFIKVEYVTTANPVVMQDAINQFSSHPNITATAAPCPDISSASSLYTFYFESYLEDIYNLNEAFNVKHAEKITIYTSGPAGGGDDDDDTCIDITDEIIATLYGN